MPELYGRRYSRAELLERVGRLEQIGGSEPGVLAGGLAEGVRVLHVRSGSGLAFTVLPDRCLDIPMITFNVRPLCWYAPDGLVRRKFYELGATGLLRSF